MKVDFFIIGPPRCASTSIATVLEKHPNVCFAQPKEPTYFCTDIPAGDVPTMMNDEEYHERHFSHYQPQEHSLIGEATPLYLMSKVAIERILAYNPEARFVALARNPVDLVYSMHATRVRVGMSHENIIDFQEAWYAQDDRRKGLRLPPGGIREAVLQYRELGSLGSQYETLFQKVAHDKIHVMVFDDLQFDFAGEMKKCFKFLELPAGSVDLSAHKEAHSSWPNETMRRVHYLLGHTISRLPFRPKLGLLKKFRTRVLRQVQRKTLPEEFRNQLAEEFSDEVDLLEKIIGRDFSHWQ